MADTNTNGNGWKTAGIVLSILAGIYFLVSLIKGELNPRKWFTPATPPSPDKTDFEQCKEANRSKPDNEPCSNCVAEGSGQPVFNGIIVNGECVRQAQPATTYIVKKYIVSKPSGAVVYTLQGNNFVAIAPPVTVPSGTEIKILAISPNRDYVNTSLGWLSVNDISQVS